MKDSGYIYIMYNDTMPGIVKIGYAKDVEQRRKQLSRPSNMPVPYKVYATYEVKEKLSDLSLHKLICDINPELRIANNKEFFNATPERAFEWLQAIAKISHTENRLFLKNKQPARKAATPNSNKGSDRRRFSDKTKDEMIFSKIPSNLIFCFTNASRGGANARMKVVNGKFIVLTGSKICERNPKAWLTPGTIKRREKYDKTKTYILKEDEEFNSPSGAAEFVNGQTASGYTNWISSENKKLRDYC